MSALWWAPLGVAAVGSAALVAVSSRLRRETAALVAVRVEVARLRRRLPRAPSP